MANDWKVMSLLLTTVISAVFSAHRKYNRMSFYEMRMWNEVFKHRSSCLQVFCKIALLKLSFFYKIAVLKFPFSKICKETPKSESLFK